MWPGGQADQADQAALWSPPQLTLHLRIEPGLLLGPLSHLDAGQQEASVSSQGCFLLKMRHTSELLISFAI